MWNVNTLWIALKYDKLDVIYVQVVSCTTYLI